MPPPGGPDDPVKLLDAQALAKIRRLELLARGVVEGFVTGRHRSPHKGFSVEFAEHRQYVPGDDVRDLDWRVFGKSDRYYVKQYMEETNLRAVILVDASGSMQYAGTAAAKLDGQVLTKFEYARMLAASLAHLLIGQQDAVGLATFDKGLRRYIAPRSRASHLRAILQELSDTEPGEETALAPIIHSIAERIHRRSLVILISDLFDDEQEILKALHHFRYRGQEVLLLHVMAEEELTFPFEDWSVFHDLEDSQRRIRIDPRAVRATYLEQIRRFLKAIETGCGQMSIDYVPMSTRQPFDTALARYLAHRQNRQR